MEARALEQVPVNAVVAHPTAADVYGEIPVDADRSERSVTLDTSKSRWLSTGMYAVPGEVVTLTFADSSFVNKAQIRISGHTDDLTSLKTLKRLPLVSREFPVDSSSVRIASAFGGAIYIDTGDTPLDLGNVDVKIQGAIRAPYFVLGETSDEDWNASIRDYPAPYAELVSDRLIFSLPAAWVRNLDNATDLMTYWNDAVEFQDWVAGTENDRKSAERINIDVQISGGAAHAGYPIQGVESNPFSPNVLDLGLMQSEGSKLWFHELGHEIQRGPNKAWSAINYYTVNDTKQVEVTVDIFSNAAAEEMALNVDVPLYEQFYDYQGRTYAQNSDQVMTRAKEGVADPRDFLSKLVGPRGVPLAAYAFYPQLADGFGWETYRKFFQTYNHDFANDQAKLPANNPQKVDQWLERWSRVSGYNMIKYMVDTWKLDASEQAKNNVNAMVNDNGDPLPSWMPLAYSIKPQHVAPGGSIAFDLQNGAMSLDDTETLVEATAPTHGTLKQVGNEYVYTPAADFVGIDEFDVTYESSAGNHVTFKQEVNVGVILAWQMDEDFGEVISNSAINTEQTGRFAPEIKAAGFVDSHKGIHFADVTGDGATDVVRVNNNELIVDRSLGTSLWWDRETWSSEGFFGSDGDGRGTFFADVTGDGKADAIAVRDDRVAVRRSTGAEFAAEEKWAEAYFGNLGTFFADVTGDGLADAIVVNASVDTTTFPPSVTGRITVRRSTGNNFAPNEDWTNVPFFGIPDGGKGTFFADVTGDGLADAIAVKDDGVVVRRSTGSEFADEEQWAGAYFGNKGTYFADVTGDGMADAIVVNETQGQIAGRVTVRRSTGSDFAPNEHWTSTPYFGTRGTFFADITGDGMADAIGIDDDQVKVRRSAVVMNGTGVLSGTQEWVEGHTGTALKFDSEKADLVTVEGGSGLFGETDFTLSAWIQTSESGGTIIRSTDLGRGEETPTGAFSLEVSTDGNVRFTISNTDLAQFEITSTTIPVNDGEWHHVVAQREDGAGRLFIDGTLDAVAIDGAAVTIVELNPDYALEIGAEFDGILDEIRIYDAVIDVAQVNATVLPEAETEPENPNLLPGDADENGEVAFADFLVLSRNFGKVDAVWADGDFDEDGMVGFSDFLILSRNFGNRDNR